jgi:hypothetical protein
MTNTPKKNGSRLVRWFKKFQERNRKPYRWYEPHDGIIG